jgi:hypothetical protein
MDYRGCYWVYFVSDPQWLMAMALAHNAVVALALGPRIIATEATATLGAWANLVQ